MIYVLLVCRSLTYAQRIQAALERAGIPGRIVRTPKAVAGEGCSHSVRIPDYNFEEARLTLKENKLPPKKIYRWENGGFQEISYDLF